MRGRKHNLMTTAARDQGCSYKEVEDAISAVGDRLRTMDFIAHQEWDVEIVMLHEPHVVRTGPPNSA